MFTRYINNNNKTMSIMQNIIRQQINNNKINKLKESYTNDNNKLNRLKEKYTLETENISIDEGNISPVDNNEAYKELIDYVRPIGSFYITSKCYDTVNNTFNTYNPNYLFPGTKWKQISQRYLYCANSSKDDEYDILTDSDTSVNNSNVKGLGGSEYITAENLPSHEHTIPGGGYQYKPATVAGATEHSWIGSNKSKNRGNTGLYSLDKVYTSGTALSSITDANGKVDIANSTETQSKFKPQYYNVFAWIRIE